MPARILILSALLMAEAAQAQLVPSDTKIEGRPVDQEFGTRPKDSAPPTSDPRDFNGNYQQIEESDDGTPWNADIVRQCAPWLEIGARGYPEKIVQTPGRLTFVQEFNHIIRRIYLDEPFPETLEPTYSGYSTGRWDGDILVVTTRAIKGTKVAEDARFKSVDEVVERIKKAPDGTITNEAKVTGLDADGQPISIVRRATLLWRPDIRLMEYICEDGAGVSWN